jgi:hypothetical protein
MREVLVLLQLGYPFSGAGLSFFQALGFRCFVMWCLVLPVDILAVFILEMCANAGFVKDFKG